MHNLPLDVRHSARVEDYEPEFLEEQMSLLKSQLNGYHQTIENERKEKEHPKEKTFDPTLPPDQKEALINAGISTPFEIAFEQMQRSILDGTHSMHHKTENNK